MNPIIRNVLLPVGLLSVMALSNSATLEPKKNSDAPIPVEQLVISQPILAAEPQSVAGEPADTSRLYPWFFSGDRAVRMLSVSWRVGRNKVPWFRPAGADLQVTGRRLDAAAPPLTVELNPRAYQHQFCASILVFPTGGYWEIVAKSGQSELRVVVKVSTE